MPLVLWFVLSFLVVSGMNPDMGKVFYVLFSVAMITLSFNPHRLAVRSRI